MPKVFISYVRENTQDVLRLVDELENAGIDVWFDKNALKPGVRWADAIREGIEEGDFFIACFSEEYSSKMKSYMNEELTLAIEELRLRPADQTWFIPVLLSKAEIPNRSIGAGETLRSIQWVELYDNWHEGLRKIISAIIPKMVWKPYELQLPDDSTMVLLPLRSKNGNATFISKFPITNKQYRRFVENYNQPGTTKPPVGEHFKLSKWEGPFYPWEEEGFSEPDKPVVCVSYSDANRYCQWVSTLFNEESYKATISLPKPEIWDFAAFGSIYASRNPDSWPRQSAAIHHNQRTPASIDSSEKRLNRRGVSDMVGNVWEWCIEAPLMFLSPDSDSAELRGGSFLDNMFITPPFINSSRLKDRLETRHSDLGFRIAASISLEVLPTDIRQNLSLVENNSFL